MILLCRIKNTKEVNNYYVGSDFMSKYISNVVNFQEYKDKKNKQLELDREELLQLIKKIVTTK